MSTWVLILSLYGTHGPAFATVSGFTPATSCTKAAKFWLDAQSWERTPKAVCVEVK